MPFNIPTPQEIVQRIQADFDTYLPGSDSRLRWTPEGVLARVIAMAVRILYGFLGWLSKQFLPDTAESEFLTRHEGIYNVERKAAASSVGIVQFTGVSGSVAVAGTILVRNDGAEYTLGADTTIAAGTASAAVTASTAGAAGNTAVGTKLTFGSPVAGFQSDATVAGDGLTGGTDMEDEESWRGRLLERIQEPPQGGSKNDYRQWAKAVAGVTRVWPYPRQLGLGTVQVLFVMDNKAGTIIPSVEEVAAVQAYLEGVRPVTADVTVTAPTAVAVNFHVAINPNSAAVKAAIMAELLDFIKTEAEPGGTLYLSRLNERISAASGEFDHVLIAPAANVVMTFGQIATLGAFTWEGL